jgi:hypothetical protein
MFTKGQSRTLDHDRVLDSSGNCWLSTDTFAAERTGGLLWRTLSTLAPRVTDAQYALLHFGIRKAAHLTEYALLAVLLLRALRAGAAAA